MIYLDLFLEFFKIGAFTFGGGYAMIPLIEQTVQSRGWLTDQEIIDFIGVSESTPGPFAVNISTYVGWKAAGIPGAALATFGVVLPAFLIMLAVSASYAKFRKNRYVNAAFQGIRPAVVGLVGAAVISVGSKVFRAAAGSGALNLASALIAAAAVVLALKKVHPILIICASAALGIVFGYAFGL